MLESAIDCTKGSKRKVFSTVDGNLIESWVNWGPNNVREESIRTGSLYTYSKVSFRTLSLFFRALKVNNDSIIGLSILKKKF